MVSENPSGGFILEGFRKRSIEAHNLVHLKQEQENVVNCLSEQRDVFGGLCRLDTVNIKHFNCLQLQ